MSAIFTLPRQVPIVIGAILAGAKLTFSQTGTSTLQNTYQDNARTVPHANPVVADSAGVFEKIFLDPTLPNYRVKLTTAANVLVYQDDDYPSNQNTQQSMRLESTNPFVFLYDTDGTSGSRKYRIRAAGNAFEVQSANEAESVFTTILQFTGGVLYSGGTEVAVTSAGTFTGTLTGCTTSPTATFNYRKVNNVVTIWSDTLLSGTSNTTAMTLTGVPVAIRPATSRTVYGSRLLDNSIEVVGRCTMTASDTITFEAEAVSGTKIIPSLFVNSGTKGVGVGWCITYALS